MLEADVAMHLRQTQQRLSQIMREKIGEYGLTFRLLHILMLIAKNPDTNQKELAEQMRLTPGAVSGSVKKLIELGMLEQIPLEDDLRCNKLVLSEHANSVLKDYEEHVFLRYKELFLGFNQDELRDFNKALLKINENLDRIDQL